MSASRRTKVQNRNQEGRSKQKEIRGKKGTERKGVYSNTKLH